MSPGSLKVLLRRSNARIAAYLSLFLATFAIAVAALIVIRPTDITTLGLQAGKVAPQDILAPYPLTYESTVLTNQQRDIAAQAVTPVYTPADIRIARDQVDQLTALLGFISTIRDDQEKTQEEKIAAIVQHASPTISTDTTEYLLTLAEEDWQVIQKEAILVLQQVMRASIREPNLEDARRNIPALVSPFLSKEVADEVAELVSIFTVPNSFYSEELTQARRQAARDAIQPVIRSFVAGETVIQRGRVISPADLEALNNFGLLKNPDNRLRTFSAIALVTAAMVFSVAALYTHETWKSLKKTSFIAAYFLVFLVAARLLTLGHVVLPYLFPLAAFGMIMAILVGTTSGLLILIPLSLLVSFEMPNPLELGSFQILVGMFAIMALGNARRITAYFWAGLAAGLIGVVLILALRLTDPFTDITGLITLAAAALANGIISASLTILLQLFSAQYLGMTTPLQLVDLSRPDQPLLRRLLTTAPGTYQHSLQVANMAEQAAELIGADALLTRVGSLYHDIGKTNNSLFFIENQPPGSANPHDSLSPEVSSRIIIQHVTDGLVLAKKYRLPARIQDFIAEHHGTTLTRYQYNKAVQAAGRPDLVDENLYRYPGPKPRTRETALVLLADSCEARARAEQPKGEIALRALIKDVIDKRLAGGQLSDTQLTTSDLNVILDTYTTALQAIYHPRIQYPELDKPKPETNLEPGEFPPAQVVERTPEPQTTPAQKSPPLEKQEEKAR